MGILAFKSSAGPGKMCPQQHHPVLGTNPDLGGKGIVQIIWIIKGTGRGVKITHFFNTDAETAVKHSKKSEQKLN